MKGAGPILVSLHEQIKLGKKLIVVDAVSVVDIEQVALAIDKTNYKILPCGSAGLAQSLANLWLDKTDVKKNTNNLRQLPKLVISGSATELTATQIKKVSESPEIDNVHIIPISTEDILQNNTAKIIEEALTYLVKDNTVIIHSSDIHVNDTEFTEHLFENEISTAEFISKIVDYLAFITREIIFQKEVILITVGGETSYQCANAIESKHLLVIDAITPAIPLCVDHKSQLFVTKSGNLGTINTLIEILNYFSQYE